MNKRSSVDELAATLRTELDHYRPDEKLPSSRTLVERYQVSPVTLSRAIAVLVAAGQVVSRPGAGVFRAGRQGRADRSGDLSWQEVALSADPGPSGEPAFARGASGVLATLSVPAPEVIDMSGGYLHSSLQPERALAAALARAGRRPGTWARPPVEGLAELRDWFARDIGVAASDVLISAGGQGALTTALRSLAAPGTAVLVESPTYPGILAVARMASLRPVPVPVDGEGVRTDLLAEAFRATRARVFVCQPVFHNPTGAILSAPRRLDVLNIAREAGAFVIEDDFARRLVHADSAALPPPLAADDPDGTVVHIRSLTKVTSPSLRIAALTARGPALERLRSVQVVDSFFVPRPLQETALELLGSPAWPAHLRAIATTLRSRRTVTVAALSRLLPDLLGREIPGGGYHLWLRLPDGADEAAIVAAALQAGVAVTPGRAYFAAEAPSPHLRLSYVSAGSTQQLTEGVDRLAQACASPPVTGARAWRTQK